MRRQLTPADLAVVNLRIAGLNARQIANKLEISIGGVNYHLRAAHQKLRLETLEQIAAALGTTLAALPDYPESAPTGRTNL